MSPIHRKTQKGVNEIETRVHGLSARMRSALILVNGKRSDSEIVALLGSRSAALLVELAWQNYIERVDQTGAAAGRAAPAEPPASAGTRRSWPTSPGRFAQLKEHASRQLTDRLGPFAQSLAERMEASETPRDLEPLLDKATVLIHNMLGAEAARSYRADLPGG